MKLKAVAWVKSSEPALLHWWVSKTPPTLRALRVLPVAALVGLWLTGQASAQVVIVDRPDSVVLGGGNWRFGPPRGVLVIGGGHYPGFVVIPQTQFIIKATLVNPKRPILGAGYDQDIRGVDLDLVPPKKPKPSEPAEPLHRPAELYAAKPLPGVEVSKSRPSVRPGDPGQEIKPLPNEKPIKQQPSPPQLPRDELGLLEQGAREFQAGDFGLAAQRFRKALDLGPKQARVYFLLAQAEFATGNYRDAVATIQAGMAIDKQWPRMAIKPSLDLYQGRQADYDNHLQRLTESAAGQPNHPALLFLLAHQLWFEGRRADALALFQRARPLTANAAFIDIFLAAGGPGDVAAFFPIHNQSSCCC
jgi:hypothetical protein